MNATPANSAASTRSRVPKKVMTPVTRGERGREPEQLGGTGAVAARRARSRRPSGARRPCRREARAGACFGDAAAIASSTPVTMPQPPSTPDHDDRRGEQALDPLVAGEPVGDVGRDDEHDGPEQHGQRRRPRSSRSSRRRGDGPGCRRPARARPSRSPIRSGSRPDSRFPRRAAPGPRSRRRR